MPETVWVPLVVFGIAAFFLTLDLIMGVSHFAFGIVRRSERPRLFWIVESPVVAAMLGGLLAFLFFMTRDVMLPLVR